MRRGLARAGAGSATSVALVLVGIASCSDREELPCTKDTDCPQGTICREERCGPVGADAIAPPPTDGASPVTCGNDGVTCAFADECCSRSCNAGRCGLAVAPTCRGVYELCQDDCCSGLRCVSGSCR